MIKDEMKTLNQRSRIKRKSGTGKIIGRIATAKKGTLRLQAESNVLARLARGGVSPASSSSTDAIQSPASSPLSSSSIASCSSASPSSVSPASSATSTFPVLGEKFLSGLILPDASYRGKKTVKYATILFAEAPELWEKYSAAAGASVPFKSAVNTQRRAVYDFMCKSIETLAPDFIDRIGIPTSEAELKTSAKAWVTCLASLPADTASPPPPPQTSASTAAVLVPPSTEPPSIQAADVEFQQLQEQMARQIALLQAQLAISQAEALKQARLRDEEKAQMFQREQMIAMAFQHQAAAAAAKALSATTSSSSAVSRVVEPRLDSGSTRGVKRLKTDSSSAPQPRPRGNAAFTSLSARYKQRVVLESSKAVTDRVGASADGRVAVAAQLVKSPTSFNLLLKLRRSQQ